MVVSTTLVFVHNVRLRLLELVKLVIEPGTRALAGPEALVNLVELSMSLPKLVALLVRVAAQQALQATEALREGALLRIPRLGLPREASLVGGLDRLQILALPLCRIADLPIQDGHALLHPVVMRLPSLAFCHQALPSGGLLLLLGPPQLRVDTPQTLELPGLLGVHPTDGFFQQLAMLLRLLPQGCLQGGEALVQRAAVRVHILDVAAELLDGLCRRGMAALEAFGSARQLPMRGLESLQGPGMLVVALGGVAEKALKVVQTLLHGSMVRLPRLLFLRQNIRLQSLRLACKACLCSL
mmetsp:Transcript_113208/g.241611  ORF Transcript_113208/g.241611 Transcript_113208/m.241611 type:complete len:298 (-) Transcript_113208:843-1736(-)